ncbi:hypothetical protein BH24ACT5_BH24ACT5_22200 [soil metagenome]
MKKLLALGAVGVLVLAACGDDDDDDTTDTTIASIVDETTPVVTLTEETGPDEIPPATVPEVTIASAEPGAADVTETTES